MKVILLAFTVLMCASSFSQTKPPSDAELKKMMNNPEVRKAMQQAGIDPDNLDASSSGDDETWKKLPAKNTARLQKLPATILTQEGLNKFITDIDARLQKAGTAESQAAVSAATSRDTSAVGLSRTAVVLWYKKDAQAALTLAAKAAVKDPSHPEILNTLGALLNLCGYEHKAIPILQALNAKLPGNATVLNNLGQAYYGLGDQQKAEQYLLMCISKLPRHPEANKSLGILYHAKGNMVKAKQCFQKSLEGAYTPTAVEGARMVGMSEEDIDRFITISLRTIKAPEYFNPYKYQLPPAPESLSQVKELSAKHRQFQELLELQISKYETLIDQEAEKINKKAEQLRQAVLSGKVVRVTAPLFEKSKRMFFYWIAKFDEWAMAEIYPAYIKYKEEEYKLDNAYNAEYVKINTGNAPDKCPLFDALANSYLPKYAFFTNDFNEKFLTPFRGYMDELVYWSQFSVLEPEARGRAFGIIKGYFQQLLGMSRGVKFIFPHCTTGTVPELQPLSGDEIEPKCPFNLKFNLIVGKLSLDCSSVEFEVDAGVSFKAKKDFVSKETTLAIGAGIDFGGKSDIPIPIINMSAGVGASQELYIVFDGEGVPVDAGMEMKVSAGTNTSFTAGPVTQSGESSSVELGYKFGFGLNSGSPGIEFTTSATGIAKGLFD